MGEAMTCLGPHISSVLRTRDLTKLTSDPDLGYGKEAYVRGQDIIKVVMEERGDRLKFMMVAAILVLLLLQLLQFIDISGNGERRSKARQSFWMRGRAVSLQI